MTSFLIVWNEPPNPQMIFTYETEDEEMIQKLPLLHQKNMSELEAEFIDVFQKLDDYKETLKQGSTFDDKSRIYQMIEINI